MGTRRKRWRRGAVGCGLVLVLAAGAPAAAQRAQTSGPGAVRNLGPAEIQRLFDAYTAMQAQEALDLDDVQFGRFLPRLKALQNTRRRFDLERQRLTTELARLMAPGTAADDARLRDQMKALSDLEVKAHADLRASADALDQMLDVRRQARFRVFEMQMERRKFELVLRARRPNAGRLPLR